MGAVGYTGGDPNKVDIAGDTMTGPLVLSGDPVVALGAATKQFAESQGGGGGGGTPSGTVVAETTYSQSASAGAASAYSRGDHTHGTPALPSPGAIGAATSGHNHSGTYDPAGSAATALASALSADVPLGSGTPAAISITGSGAAGASTSSSHSDHTHAGPGFGNVVTETSFGQASGNGSASSVARSDHTHGTPTAPTVPSAAGTVAAETSYGVSSAVGVATTYARGDHTHGSPSLTAVTPSTSAVGDSAVVGTGVAPAREDHKHAREAFGAVTAQTSFGASSGNGAATTIARSDHTHGTPAAPTVPSAASTVTAETSFAQSSSAGAAATYSRGDHTHGSPTQPAETVMFGFTGTAVITTGVLRWYNRTGRTLTIIGAWVAANTAPTGADMRADVNKNGTTIFTTQGNRPTAAAATNGGGISATPDVTSVSDGDFLTADIDVVGSSVAGSNVTVGVVYR